MNQPASPGDGDNARLGMVMFAIYFVIYALFVWLCTFRLDAMGRPWIAGINFAVWYGFGLIFVAFVLAVIYLLLARK